MGQISGGWIGRARLEVPCTIEIEHSSMSLHAHVNLDGDIEIHPGDEVIVHGEPLSVPFGERKVERRRATIIRANLIDRLATKLSATFELTELYEVSFTPRRTL